MHRVLSAVRYLARKTLTILIAIFLAVFLTMIIVDVPIRLGGDWSASPFQMRLEDQIYQVVRTSAYRGLIATDESGEPLPSEVDAIVQRLRSDAGLHLPYVPRYLLWTYKSLTFSWGELDPEYLSQIGLPQRQRSEGSPTLILQHLPNTLLLVATAYLLVFLLGMPFALHLARNYDGWLDRFMSVLSPISSVPSWVFGLLLISIFAVQLRWLPVSGMFGFHRPTEPIPYVLALLWHMLLPVTALVLSLWFQLVYTWRTFFIIYAEEDYVDLARAKGLDTHLLQMRYIVRPALPYIITTFTTSLIGFWQLTIALEKVFAWPGLGYLYLDALPSFWGETMEIGDLMIVVQIVVTFGYLLGILVILLELAYVIVDPRVHLIHEGNTVEASRQRGSNRAHGTGLSARREGRAPSRTRSALAFLKKTWFSIRQSLNHLRGTGWNSRGSISLFIEQLRLYPSALFGLTVIALLLAGSLYALFVLPYEEIGINYNWERVSGRSLMPRTAAPAWLNVFRQTPLLSRILLDENSEDVVVSKETLENGWVQKIVTYEFDYFYSEIPSDLFIYIDSDYEEKIPFVSFQWLTPDGRMIDLKSRAMAGESSYDLDAGVNVKRLLLENPEWENWFATDGPYPTPAYQLLFAKPGSEEPIPQQGRYQLTLTSLLFEEESDAHSQLVILGQVYGIAGTDYWRRDLLLPLLWGMPVSLTVGFVGAVVLILIAVLLPAIGVWYGGWLDTAIQRLTEINMVLPGLAIAAVAYALHGVHIWVILVVVVILSALGAPIKSFRSALLQAKEAPYIEMARSYGASNFRIILRYLIPRILPSLIPYLVMQIPTFIFLEATLGFFRIQSVYPSWGKIIHEALTRSDLYGSSFWVLEPIFLLLLTGLAFAMLGLALERLLNPRLVSDVPAISKNAQTRRKKPDRSKSAVSA